MCVRISNDGQTSLAAKRPQSSEGTAIQYTDPRIVSGWVQIIIKHHVLNLQAASYLDAEQKHTRFVTPLTAAIELPENGVPEISRTADTVLRRCERPYSRSK